MKKKQAKKVEKKETKKQPKMDIFDKILSVLCVTVLLGTLGYIIYDFVIPKATEFEVGDCVIRRDYSPAKIVSKYNSLKEYGLRPQIVKDSNIFNGWYLDDDYDYAIVYRDMNFVTKYYTKVSCNNLD